MKKILFAVTAVIMVTVMVSAFRLKSAVRNFCMKCRKKRKHKQTSQTY